MGLHTGDTGGAVHRQLRVAGGHVGVAPDGHPRLAEQVSFPERSLAEYATLGRSKLQPVQTSCPVRLATFSSISGRAPIGIESRLAQERSRIKTKLALSGLDYASKSSPVSGCRHRRHVHELSHGEAGLVLGGLTAANGGFNPGAELVDALIDGVIHEQVRLSPVSRNSSTISNLTRLGCRP